VVNQGVRMKIYPKDEKKDPKKKSQITDQDQLSSSK